MMDPDGSNETRFTDNDARYDGRSVLGPGWNEAHLRGAPAGAATAYDILKINADGTAETNTHQRCPDGWEAGLVA